MAKTKHQIVPTPVDDTDAANKAYVDANSGGGPGGLEFVDQIIVGVTAAQQLDFNGASGDGVESYDLDLDQDEKYILELVITKPTSTDEITLRPNNATTNQKTNLSGLSGSTPSEFLQNTNNIRLVNTGGDAVYSRCEISQANDVKFFLNSAGSILKGASNDTVRFSGTSSWESASNMTRLVVRSSNASGFAQGTVAKLFKVTTG